MSSLPLAELVEDFSIYPRHAVDDANVAALVNALRAGAALPPIVVDRASRRIVDGWHRARAYRRVLGPTAVVEAEEIDYASEEELLKDAIRRNAAHGRKLDAIDQVRAIQLCEERGIPHAAVAVILNLPLPRVEKLSVRLATASHEGPGTITGTTMVALKRAVLHLAGQELTDAQVAAHERAPGVSYLLIARQLHDALTEGFINPVDARLIAACRQLQADLAAFFKRM